MIQYHFPILQMILPNGFLSSALCFLSPFFLFLFPVFHLRRDPSILLEWVEHESSQLWSRLIGVFVLTVLIHSHANTSEFNGLQNKFPKKVKYLLWKSIDDLKLRWLHGILTGKSDPIPLTGAFLFWGKCGFTRKEQLSPGNVIQANHSKRRVHEKVQRP